MSTESTAQLDGFSTAWEDHCGYTSAVCSGIKGDLAHRRRGGYHISIADNPAGNFSVVRPDDKAPPGGWPRNRAAAVDMSLSTKDMILCHGRVRRVFNDRSDPRRRYLNAVNCWDGTGDAVRLDFVANTAGYATPDHRWHTHLEFRRRYVNDPVAMGAVLSILRGESAQRWQTNQHQEDDVTRDELHAELVKFFGAHAADYLYNTSSIVADTARGKDTAATQWNGAPGSPLPLTPNVRLKTVEAILGRLAEDVQAIREQLATSPPAKP